MEDIPLVVTKPSITNNSNNQSSPNSSTAINTEVNNYYRTEVSGSNNIESTLTTSLPVEISSNATAAASKTARKQSTTANTQFEEIVITSLSSPSSELNSQVNKLLLFNDEQEQDVNLEGLSEDDVDSDDQTLLLNQRSTNSYILLSNKKKKSSSSRKRKRCSSWRSFCCCFYCCCRVFKKFLTMLFK